MTEEKTKIGKKSRKEGKAFEVEVRKDLERQGWIVSKWSNQVKDGIIVPARGQFNPFFHRIVGEGSGFPDFVCFRLKQAFAIVDEFDIFSEKNLDYQLITKNDYEVIGVESKMKGKLDKEEKEKCAVYLTNKTFNRILIASKCAEGVKYEEMRDV